MKFDCDFSTRMIIKQNTYKDASKQREYKERISPLKLRNEYKMQFKANNTA